MRAEVSWLPATTGAGANGFTIVPCGAMIETGRYEPEFDAVCGSVSALRAK